MKKIFLEFVSAFLFMFITSELIMIIVFSIAYQDIIFGIRVGATFGLIIGIIFGLLQVFRYKFTQNRDNGNK